VAYRLYLPQDDIAKLRWRIERDYQELKQEVGLGHFEGRGWRGFRAIRALAPGGGEV
jgi:SRSO17 transposase